MPIELTVLGRPQPAGSKRAFPRRGGGVIVTDDNPRAKSWQQEIRMVAVEAMNGDEIIDGPIELFCKFILARPLGHFGTGRNAGTVRLGAPVYPTVKPDTTKLIRAVEDALTGIVWRDDAQVIRQRAYKAYGTPERVEVVIWPIVAQA
jgi:Holliday junction resolvase RusA-like endonuclease